MAKKVNFQSMYDMLEWPTLPREVRALQILTLSQSRLSIKHGTSGRLQLKTGGVFGALLGLLLDSVAN